MRGVSSLYALRVLAAPAALAEPSSTGNRPLPGCTAWFCSLATVLRRGFG